MKTRAYVPWLPFIVLSTVAVFAAACLAGWVRNILEIAGADFAHLTGLLVLRVVGVFVPPLGAVLGFV